MNKIGLTPKKLLAVFAVIAVLSMLLTACSGAKGPYSLQSAKQYGQTVETYIPEEILAKQQVVVILPAGSNPDLKWTTHLEGGNCTLFSLNEENLPTVSAPATEGMEISPAVKFSFSCDEGARIWWDRTLPKASTAAPTTTQ